MASVPACLVAFELGGRDRAESLESVVKELDVTTFLERRQPYRDERRNGASAAGVGELWGPLGAEVQELLETFGRARKRAKPF